MISTYSAFDRVSGLEPLLRVLQLDVRVMQRPHNTIDAARHIYEDCLVGESTDRALEKRTSINYQFNLNKEREAHLHDFSNLDLAHLHEPLL